MNVHLLKFSLLLCLFIAVASVLRAEEEEEDHPQSVVAVQTGPIVRATLRKYVVAYGTVESAPATAGQAAAGARVAPSAAGVIAETLCEEGQRIGQGDILFRLDSRVAGAEIVRAQATVDFAQKLFDRQRQLFTSEGTSQKAVDEAAQQLALARQDLSVLQAQRQLLDVTAPLAGTVMIVHARPGEAVDGNSVLVEIADLDRLQAVVRIPSPEAAPLHAGETVYIRRAVEENLEAKVQSISQQVDPETDTVVARIPVPASAHWRPGQFVEARIVSEERPGVLAAPVGSVISADGQSWVAIVEGDQATRIAVQTGLRDGDLVEIRGEDLKEGLAIVTAGAYGLPPETKVRLVNP